MKILQNYLTKTILQYIALTACVLLAIEFFLLFVNELDDIGRGQYHFISAFLFVTSQLPSQLYQLFPMVSLIGCLIALGLLVSHSELTVMRASGVSIAQIIFAVVKAAFILIVLMTIMGETIVPYAMHYAQNKKAVALSGGQAMRVGGGVWVRQRQHFIHIDKVQSTTQLQGIQDYQFNQHHRLALVRKAALAKFQDNHWQLQNVDQTQFMSNKTKATHYKNKIWDVAFNPRLLSITTFDPEEMNLATLYHYIKIKKRNHSAVGRYEFSFWQRLWQPITTCVMMLLAIPFIFGSLRANTLGARLLVGLLIGFLFYMLNRFFGPLSLVYQYPPMLAAMSPTLLFALAGIFLMKRVK